MVTTNDGATLVGGKSNLVVGLPTPPPASRYDVIEEINRGGCGVVLRAYDRHLHCDVALKRILPELAQDAVIQSRFFHEARVTARLAHPGIVPIHDMGEGLADEPPFYTMKWLQGQTLVDAIKSHHALPSGRQKSRSFRELLVRFRQVCLTLSYAHQQGVVHRDLKPSNILIGQFGETIVLDWGLAKELNLPAADNTEPEISKTIDSLPPVDHGSAADVDLTRVGSVLGTATYMSPEQAAGQSHLVDRRADVFSLGVILYEIISGTSPFRCPTQQESMQHILRSEYRPLQQLHLRVPKALAAICDRALKCDANLRYADAGELERDIQAWLAGDGVSAYAEPWWGTLDRLASKNRTAFWSAFVCLLLVACVASMSTLAVSSAHRDEKRARQAADVAHSQMVQSFAREQVAHQEAVSQLQQARSSIDGWLLGLDSVLSFYPGLSPLRKQLFHQAIDYYTVLSEQPAQSDVMKMEVNRARIRLADLQHLNGHSDDALRNYQQAIAQLRSIPPTQNDWQVVNDLQLAAGLLGSSEIAIDRMQLENVEEAIDFAIKLCESTTEPALLREAYGLQARGFRLKSMVFRQQGDLDQAQRAIKQALAIYEAHILPTTPLQSTTQERQSFTAMQDELASILFDAHDFAGANDALHQMIHFYDRLLETDPQRPDWLEARALSRTRSGWCYMQMVDPNQAVAQLEASEDDLQNAWQLFKGEHTFLDKLSQIQNALGHSYFVGGDLDQAYELLTRSLKHTTVKPDHHLDSEALWRWVQTRLYLATIQLRRGAEDMTILHNVEESLAALRSHSKLHPLAEQSHAQYSWLQAQSQFRSGMHDDAATTLKLAIERQMLQPEDRQDAAWHFWLGRLFAYQSVIETDRNQIDAASLSLKSAHDHWQAANRSTEKRWSAHAAFELFESWIHEPNIGEDRLQAAIEIAHNVVSDHPTLPTAWFWLAELAYHQGDYELAKSSQEKLDRLRRRETLEDRLLKALIKTDSVPSSELLHASCVPGSHAEWLQKKLSDRQ